MNRFHLLLSVFFAFLAYTIIVLLFGKAGLWAYSQLRNQKIEMSVHIVYLEDIHEQLAIDKSALEHDKDVIAAYAKKMGFIGVDEKLVKVNGMMPISDPVYVAGELYIKKEIIFVPEWIAKTVGFLIFIFYNFFNAIFYLKPVFLKSDNQEYYDTL